MLRVARSRGLIGIDGGQLKLFSQQRESEGMQRNLCKLFSKLILLH